MRIVYIATAEIACPPLQALHEDPNMEVILVISQPDRPQGRKRQLAASPVKKLAQTLGIEVITPDAIGDSSVLDQLEALQPDLNVVFAYGQYIPSRITELPQRRSINVHPSMLPRYRGASPIQSALLDGLTQTGISIIYVSEKMDAGDILLQEPLAIAAEDTSASLSEKVAECAGPLLLRAIEGLVSGSLVARVQDESAVVEVSKIEKADGVMDWSESATTLNNKIRAYFPWPGSSTTLPDGLGLKVLVARVESATGDPGTVLDVTCEGPLVACGEGSLRLVTVQPAGKKAMAGDAFLRGYGLERGSNLSGGTGAVSS